MAIHVVYNFIILFFPLHPIVNCGPRGKFFASRLPIFNEKIKTWKRLTTGLRTTNAKQRQHLAWYLANLVRWA